MPFKRLLIAVDGSPISTHAADAGLELAAALGAKVALVHVIEPAISDASIVAVSSGEMMQSNEAEVAQVFAGLRAKGTILEDAEKLIRVGPATTAIAQAAQEWSADLVVIGSHGRDGLGRVLLGSVAEQLARHAPCPVLIIRNQN